MELRPNETNMSVEYTLGPRVVAVIPAYNEERFIASVVLKARKYASHVIVVDDGSCDDTSILAEEAGAKVVKHKQNLGKGAALQTGFRAALAENPEVVVMLDADGQHRPEELQQLVVPVLTGQADIVIGSRYLDKISLVPRHRIWGHKVFNIFTRIVAGVGSSDSQSGFRAFSPLALEALVFRSNGFSVESEMQFIAKEHGLRLVETPITINYTDRPKRPVWQHGLLVINGILRFGGQYRPLLFFGLPGVLVILVGLGMGFLVVDIYRRSQQLAVGYAMLSILTTIIGMIGLSMGIILHSVRGLLIDFFEHGLHNGNELK